MGACVSRRKGTTAARIHAKRAQTQARLAINRTKKIYPPNSLRFKLRHNDARVTIHFKGPNKNSMPAKDIM